MEPGGSVPALRPGRGVNTESGRRERRLVRGDSPTSCFWDVVKPSERRGVCVF